MRQSLFYRYKKMNLKFESLIDQDGKSFIDSFMEIVPAEAAEQVGENFENAQAMGFSSLVGEVISALTGSRGELASFLIFIIGSVMLMAAASLITGKLSRQAECAAALVCGVAIFGRIYSVVTQTVEAVGGVLNFFAAFVPIITGVVAYGGGVGAAAVGASGANMTLGIIGTFVLPIMNSCASLIFALGLVGAVGNDGTHGLACRVKSFFMWLVGLCSVLLLSSLALQTAITSSSDTAAVRAAKYAASGTIPIVGNAVSSAMGALGAGVSYIKSAVGTGALCVILMLALSPLVMLLAYRAIISIGEGILEFLGISFGTRMLGAFKSALDVLIAVFSMTVTVLIIETVIMMKSGVGAI